MEENSLVFNETFSVTIRVAVFSFLKLNMKSIQGYHIVFILAHNADLQKRSINKMALPGNELK